MNERNDVLWWLWLEQQHYAHGYLISVGTNELAASETRSTIGIASLLRRLVHHNDVLEKGLFVVVKNGHDYSYGGVCDSRGSCYSYCYM